MEEEDASPTQPVYFAGSYYFSPDEVIDHFGEDNEDMDGREFAN
jgi:hypothetical protein